MFPVAILAGGMGKRLYPITQTIPKSLVLVAGKAFIIHQLEYLRDQGVKEVILCVNHLGEMIQNIIGNGENFSIKISYSYDGLISLGTGGAIAKSLPLLGDNFFILYGDTFLPINFNEIAETYKINKTKALMTVFKNDNKWDKSNVMFTNNRLIKYNKYNPTTEMNYIDYGLSVVGASVFKDYSIDKNFDLADVYKNLSESNSLSGFEVHERFYEIGSLSGFQETENYFLKKKKI
jgi:MurNAc alpha-1-phosphate uridylyltransferase